jgi:site-specific DNA-methyltransferase (adenine-specific)
MKRKHPLLVEPASSKPVNRLYYGDNLEVLRNKIRDETIDLCYIDPPFNSKRNYFQIYNNIGKEDLAQAHAFVDTWEWGPQAQDAYEEIIGNANSRFTRQTIELVKGFQSVLKTGSLLAYLVSMTLRITEIQRVLKPTGSFYFHCDPTSSHYLKLVIDAVFCPNGGDFRNEIIWAYNRWSAAARKFQGLHDVIFFYTKGAKNIHTFNLQLVPYTEKTNKRWKGERMHNIVTPEGKLLKTPAPEEESKGANMGDVWNISILNSQSRERLGYPTQKPEALLERIIIASSNEGDTVLDAYCGCGTSIAVAQRLKRNWIGIDITYQSISLILKRLEDTFNKALVAQIDLDGIPKDIESARALANKRDDRLRKEFEKWAVLTYSDNRAAINTKKGADEGIDGVAYFFAEIDHPEKIVFQVKSGKVGRGDIAKLNHDRQREGAQVGVFITLEEPTRDMIKEARNIGQYNHEQFQRKFDIIEIVTIKEMIEGNKRIGIPINYKMVQSAESAEDEDLQIGMDLT